MKSNGIRTKGIGWSLFHNSRPVLPLDRFVLSNMQCTEISMAPFGFFRHALSVQRMVRTGGMHVSAFSVWMPRS